MQKTRREIPSPRGGGNGQRNGVIRKHVGCCGRKKGAHPDRRGEETKLRKMPRGKKGLSMSLVYDAR